MTDEDIAGEETGFGRIGRWVGLVLGPAWRWASNRCRRPRDYPQKLGASSRSRRLMVVWWVTEAIPIAATALLPLAALPLSAPPA